jgi:hypothetical protein
MAKVWNITDHPGTSLPPRVMMVLGRSIRPGKCINVQDALLVNAHKVNRAVKAGKLFIGPKLPGDYLLAKNRGVKVELPDGVARAHGPVAGATKVLKDKPVVKEAVTAKLKKKSPEPVEPTPKSEDGDSDSKKKGKKPGRL